MTVRLGCDIPYFEDPDDIRAFAQAAEEIGFDHIGFSEHIASSRATEYPTLFLFDDPWHESFTMLAYLAAVTTTIELSSAMALITLRDPVLVAKQAAEIDLLSRGRLRLGVSVGWNREEQRALGVDPATRGRRIEEMVPLLRRLWTEDSVTHHGEAFVLDEVGIHPRPSRAIPIWMGGGGFESKGEPSELSMRRAARLAEGFKLMAPTGADVNRAIGTATRLRELAADQGRTLEIEARLLTQLTPPEEWASVARRYRESGVVTHLGLGNRIVGGTVHDQIALIRDVERRVRPEL
jgi:probable F420-dependent oxidoreductase